MPEKSHDQESLHAQKPALYNTTEGKSNSQNGGVFADQVKSPSIQLQVPQITLPKGGGAIKSIDEKFSVNAINGTAAFSMPLPVSGCRGFSPTVDLSYNSGGG